MTENKRPHFWGHKSKRLGIERREERQGRRCEAAIPLWDRQSRKCRDRGMREKVIICPSSRPLSVPWKLALAEPKWSMAILNRPAAVNSLVDKYLRSDTPAGLSLHAQGRNAQSCTLIAVHYRLPVKNTRAKQSRTSSYEVRSESVQGCSLGIAGHGPQLAWQEVIWRPRAANQQFAILQLLGGTAVAILIFFD